MKPFDGWGNHLLAFVVAALLPVAALAASPAAPDKPGKFIEVPGARMWVVDTGGSGQPVMLLHPSTGTSQSWENQIDAFSRAGYRVIAPDRRGWGNSTAVPATGPQPGTAADDIDAVADQLALGRFHLVAVAGGAFIAMDYAAWRKERLLSLVLGASTGSIRDAEVQAFIKRIEIPELRKQSPAYREVGASYRGANPGGLERWLHIDHHARQKDAPSQPFRSPNTYAKLATLDMPTLVIAGGADLIAPPAMMKLWAGHIRNSQWAVIADAGHSIAWEQPGQFNDLVLRFLKQTSR